MPSALSEPTQGRAWKAPAAPFTFRTCRYSFVGARRRRGRAGAGGG